MQIQVAVGSSNGSEIDLHYGKSDKFYVYSIDENGYRLNEIRNVEPVCKECGTENHDMAAFANSIGLLADCRFLLVSKIGNFAVNRLEENNIQVFTLSGSVDTALNKMAGSGFIKKILSKGVSI